MHLAILLPSRHNHKSLETALRVLHELESCQNEIGYIVGCDDDDPETQGAVKDIPGVAMAVQISPTSVGGIFNDMAKRTSADILALYGDDLICLTQGWDAYIVKACEQHLAGSWNTTFTTNPVTPFVTRKWLDAVDYLMPEHFPFWFNDTWLEELYGFTTNGPLLRFTDIVNGGKLGATKNMRELDWWWGFYNATREIRIAEAFDVAKKLGTYPCETLEDFMASRANIINHYNARDIEMRQRIPNLQQALGSKDAPSARYELAKIRAEQYLIANKLTLWGVQ